MKILSVKLDDDVARNLEDESLRSGKNPESVLADVITRYIHYGGWQQDLLEFSLEGAERNDFATSEEIASVFTRWGVAPEPDRAESAPGRVVADWSGLGLRALRKELEHLGKTRPDEAAALARAIWREAGSSDLTRRAFPGMASGSLEAELACGDYCLAFREVAGKRQILGVVPGR